MQWVKNICRLCGQVEENSYNIFNSEDNLEEKIKKYLNLEIYKEDFKPKQICNPCYHKLNDLSNFFDVCYETNSKFDSVYYTEPWHHNSDKMLYEPVDTPKQSVIVSNRQSHDHSTQFYRQPSNRDVTMGLLPNYTLNQPENILGFSVNYNNIQPDDIQNCFNECDNFDKQENMTPARQSGYEQNEKTVTSCLVNENDPSDLLDTVENEPSPVANRVSPCGVMKYVLVSVEDVRKSLKTDNLLETNNSNSKTKKSFSCPHCEKIFLRRSNLNAHIAIHTKVRPYKCSNCLKTFAVKCHLTQHKKTHLDIFVCQICHKNFDVPSKLSRHLQIHSNNRPFMCNFPNCKKSFSDKNNLKQHTLLHSLEKNFCCVICTKQFKTSKNLKAHLTRHDNNDDAFQCKFCQKFFMYKHNLQTHLAKHVNKTDILS